MYGTHADKDMHDIISLIAVAPNLKELTYTNGKMRKICFDKIESLEKLVLINIHINDSIAFQDLLLRSKNSLKILHFDNASCCTLLSELPNVHMIYSTLPSLSKLEELKIISGNFVCEYENLEIPPLLRSLTIYAPEHIFIFPLFTTLKRIIIENLTLELRHCRHNRSSNLSPNDCQRMINELKAHQNNMTFIRERRTYLSNV